MPICPRPYEQEAAFSWLSRVGDVYGLNAERLVGSLGLVPFRPRSGSRLMQPVEAALEPNRIDILADAAQLPSSRLVAMRPDPVGWTLTHSKMCSVCPQCLKQDLSSGRLPFLRVTWRQAWRIFCPVHRTRLIFCSMQVVRGRWETSRLIAAIDTLLECSLIIEEHIAQLMIQNPHCARLTTIIREMEQALGRAMVGEAPNELTWGLITAGDFLHVTQDVMMWSLTNFEAFKARPATEDLPSHAFIEGTPYYRRNHLYQQPYDNTVPARHLSAVNDPELRCPALWWAHALLSSPEYPIGSSAQELTVRQCSMLRLRCVTGIHWLAERMRDWPDQYVRQRWYPIERLLWTSNETVKHKIPS